ncbi:MAG: NfeD family protein [Bacilli bacterium]
MDWIFWLILVIVLTIIEVATVNLLTIWFVISGIVALILSFFIEDVAIVSTIFAVLGIILLITTRPILKKYLPTQRERTNIDRVIGMKGIVTEEIKKNVIGEVKVDGKKWSAISNKKIEVGEEVIVDAIDGVKLIVRKGDK